jgi:hypothetical protein
MSGTRIPRAALAALTLATLSGCTHTPIALRNDGLLPFQAMHFKWRDARPADQRESELESGSISNCAYGSFRLGDDRFTPNRVSVLRSDLERALGAELAGRSVSLQAYTVHLNRAARFRNGASPVGLLGALADAALNDRSVHGCGPDDLRGSYLSSEVTTSFSPLVVVMDVEVDGRPVHARHVESAPRELGDGAPGWHEFVSQAIVHAREKLVANIRAGLVAPSSAGSGSNQPG